MRIILFILLLFPFLSFSQFEEKKIYTTTRTTDSPKIDGKLNDNIWQNLESAKNFTQLEPNNGVIEKKDQKTEVKICYDNQNLYFGIMMYDNAPDSILTELSKRDQDNKNFDGFGIWINPFNDGQIEYSFFITAAGVQIDRKFSTTGVDYKWDAVWKSAVNINEKGWSAELAIPFSSIRFPDNNQDWAINMARSIRRYRQVYSWNPIDVSYDNFALQAGLLRGIKDIESPIRLSFMPYASIYTEMYNDETSFPYNYGMDLKYGINESFTLDMTLIPDFGQVASDAEILNLSPFEIRYEEKRQFFNEGTELFNKGGNMFYSRRIQDDLINATKVSGRTKNGLGFATLNAVTNATEEKPLTNYNVIIFDQSFGNGSSVSIMNTNMTQDSCNNDANVIGVFTKINNKSNTHSFSGNAKISQEFQHENIKNGFSGSISASKINGKLRYNLWSYFEDDKFNPNDLGYLQANNEIKSGIAISYHQLKENERFISSKAEYDMSYESLYSDGNGSNPFVNMDLNLDGSITLKNYLSIWGKISVKPMEGNDFYEARTGNFTTPIKTSKLLKTRMHFSTDYRKKIAIDLSLGGSIEPLYNGKTYHWRVSPRYRVNDKMSLKYVISIENKYNNVGFVTSEISPIFIDPPDTIHIFGIRDVFMITNVLEGSYILNNKMNIATKLRHYWSGLEYHNDEYMKLNPDGYTTLIDYYGDHNTNFNTWTVDMAFNWWFAPGSQMSLVWKNSMQDYNDIFIPGLFDNLEQTFASLQQNSISFKIMYYLDYLYLKKK